MAEAHRCRFCSTPLHDIFVDLGASPLANSYLEPDQLLAAEAHHRLTVYVCRECLLVQLPAFVSPADIFSDYAYFSSFSDSWVEHARQYVESVRLRFVLGPSNLAVEIASNDGYLLQFLHKAGVPVLGIEPAANVAAAAQAKGIPTLVRFFGSELAAELASSGRRADLLVGNNVLAHVPSLNDFVDGLRILLAERGVITMEVPHLLELIRQGQFDTIYHEHFSYFSVTTLRRIFAAHQLRLFDVELLPTHGGSLRIYAAHAGDTTKAETPNVDRALQKEKQAGLDGFAGYAGFEEVARKVKRDLLSFLISAKEKRRRIAAYGAPAKGNTLLNYCGIGTDFIDFTVDRSPHKQNLFLPGSRIPIYAPDKLAAERPDFVLILPWNLREEIVSQTAFIREWGGKWIIAVPHLEVID